jgi:hypothetical protein
MSSGDEIQAGRYTTAESTTALAAALPSEEIPDFNGDVILDVLPQSGRLTPGRTVDAIHGAAHNGAGPYNGTGVVGFGMERGTGVAGWGGLTGFGDSSTIPGGIGVHGLGASLGRGKYEASIQAGVGVVGQGGAPDGAGVIAQAGFPAGQLPAATDTAGVGLYAQGVQGTYYPGPGVVGVGGGVRARARGPVAAGVIGLAGGVPIPPLTVTGNSGVYGAGPSIGVSGAGPIGVSGAGTIGVQGRGTGGPGVDGASDNDRGGTFESGTSAQVRLVPRKLRKRAPGQIPVTPSAFAAGDEPALPADGRGGDLLVIEMTAPKRPRTRSPRSHCTLWFCVEGQGTGPARWAQVLVGPSVIGQL